MADRTVLDRFNVQGISYPTEVGVIEIRCRAVGCGWSTETTDDPIPLAALVDLGRAHLKEAHGG